MPEIFPADDQDPAEFFGQLLDLAEGRPDRVRVQTGSGRATAVVDDGLYEAWQARRGVSDAGSDTSDDGSDDDAATSDDDDPEEVTDSDEESDTSDRESDQVPAAEANSESSAKGGKSSKSTKATRR